MLDESITRELLLWIKQRQSMLLENLRSQLPDELFDLLKAANTEFDFAFFLQKLSEHRKSL